MGEFIFWVLVALIIYTYLGYPVLLALVAALRPRPVRRAPITPSVSLVVVVITAMMSMALTQHHHLFTPATKMV